MGKPYDLLPQNGHLRVNSADLIMYSPPYSNRGYKGVANNPQNRYSEKVDAN